MTYCSGSRTATFVLTLLWALLCYWSFFADSQANTPLADKYLLSGVITAFLALYLVLFAYGMRSLSVNDGVLSIRNYFKTYKIRIDSIEGIRMKIERPPFFTNQGTDPVRLVIFYKDEKNQPHFASTPIAPFVFGKDIYTVIQLILEKRPDTPIYEKSFGGALKANKVEVQKPIDSFPIQHNTTRAALKDLGLLPRFSESTLFIMSISFFFLLFTNATLWQDIRLIFQIVGESHNNKAGNIIIFLIFIVIGAIYSIFHTFSSSKKSYYAKYFMIIFGVGMTSGSAIGIGYHMWHALNIYNGIPILWNLTYGIWLLFTYTTYLGEDAISNKNAQVHEILLGMLVVGSIIYLWQLKIDAYWGFIYSACITYATAANRYVNDGFIFLEKKMKLKIR